MALLKSIQALKGGSIKIVRGQSKDRVSNNESTKVENVQGDSPNPHMYGNIMQQSQNRAYATIQRMKL